MIVHDTPRHNVRPRFPAGLKTALALFLALALAGCGGDSGGDSGSEADKRTESAPAPSNCDAAMNTRAWDGFLTLAERLDGGEIPPAGDIQAWADLPVMQTWLESISHGNQTSTPHLDQWLEGAFWDKVGQGRKFKPTSDRRVFGDSFRLNYDLRQGIQERLNAYAAEDQPCRLLDLAGRWINQDRIPSPLVVYFVASKPELRSYHGHLLVDTSLFLASSTDQLNRQMVANLYRERQAMDGPNPLEIKGRPAVAHTIRLLMNEGIAAYIEDMPSTHFSEVHPRLADLNIVPETIFDIGIRVMGVFNNGLPRMLSDEDYMAEQGHEVGRAMVAMGAFTRGGYCLAATIAARLGDERLVAVRHDPLGFLNAYQEAALQNSLPLPRPGAAGHELYESMPAFSDEVLVGLREILQETFPGPGQS